MTTITNLADTITAEVSPAKNYAGRPELLVRNASGRHAYSWLIARGLPVDKDAVVTAAYFRLYPVASYPSRTYQARRPLAGWTSGGLKYANQPSVSGTAHVTTGAATKQQPFDVDVTALAQAWMTGASPNYGVRLETTSTASDGMSFYSMNATGTLSKFKPVFVVEYSTKPDRPEAIVATGGAVVSTPRPWLEWRYADDSRSPMVAYQLQLSGSNSWSAPYFDTGEKPSDLPVAPWQTDDMSAATPVWWRVRHKSQAGRWSDWSDGNEIEYRPQPTLSVTAPSGGVVGYTPTVTWSLSSGTQRTWSVSIFRVGESASIVTASGVGADTSWQPSKALGVTPGTPLRARVLVTDEYDRISNNNDPSWIEAVSAEFTVGGTGGPPVPTALSVDQSGPRAELRWRCASSPDSFVVERTVDGGEWLPIAADLSLTATGGTNFEWFDSTAPARRPLQYRVRSVVDNSLGNVSSVASIELAARYVYLLDADDPSWSVAMAGDEEIDWEFGEDSTVVEIKGSPVPVLIHEGFRGRSGTVTGLFVDDMPDVGLSAHELEAALWRTKREPTKVWRLAVGSLNIPVVVRMVEPVEQPGQPGRYGVSMECYQVGEIDWDKD